MFGPIRRLDSKFSSAAAPGKNNPTLANKRTALRSPLLGSTKNGERHQKRSVDVGMLIATPTQGSIDRNPNWVSTKPAPNPNIDATESKIAVVMGAVPHESCDAESKIVGPATANNAEVANRHFGRSEDCSSLRRPAAQGARPTGVFLGSVYHGFVPLMKPRAFIEQKPRFAMSMP